MVDKAPTPIQKTIEQTVTDGRGFDRRDFSRQVLDERKSISDYISEFGHPLQGKDTSNDLQEALRKMDGSPSPKEVTKVRTIVDYSAGSDYVAVTSINENGNGFSGILYN